MEAAPPRYLIRGRFFANDEGDHAADAACAFLLPIGMESVLVFDFRPRVERIAVAARPYCSPS
jgi:hypothetical protein